MKETEDASTFLSLKLDDLPIQRFGEIEFKQIRPRLEELRNLIREMIEGAEGGNLPHGIIQNVHGFIKRWNGFYRQINLYNLQENATARFANRTSIVQNVHAWYEECNNGFRRENSNFIPTNFFTTYSVVKSLSFKNEVNKIGDANKLFTDFQSDLGEKTKEINLIIGGLRNTAAEIVFLNYSKIFQ